jgi:hypothetical protein
MKIDFPSLFEMLEFEVNTLQVVSKTSATKRYEKDKLAL